MIYFGIPTYKRAHKQATLEYLESVGVQREQIIMSVQTETDYAEYKEQGYDKRVGALLYHPENNLSGNINTILTHIPLNAKIVIMDDDIKMINRLSKDKLVPINTSDEFKRFIEEGYGLANKLRTVGFSVYPVNNAYFMSNSYNDKHIGEGTLLALTNDGMLFDTRFDTKCDYDYTCRIIKKYGAYPRLNMYACHAPHYTKGGCEDNWADRKRVLRDAATLLRMYPEYVKENKRRQGEVLMRRIGNKVSTKEIK